MLLGKADRVLFGEGVFTRTRISLGVLPLDSLFTYIHRLVAVESRSGGTFFCKDTPTHLLSAPHRSRLQYQYQPLVKSIQLPSSGFLAT